jgi:hypothetical protein
MTRTLTLTLSTPRPIFLILILIVSILTLKLQYVTIHRTNRGAECISCIIFDPFALVQLTGVTPGVQEDYETEEEVARTLALCQ